MSQIIRCYLLDCPLAGFIYKSQLSIINSFIEESHLEGDLKLYFDQISSVREERKELKRLTFEVELQDIVIVHSIYSLAVSPTQILSVLNQLFVSSTFFSIKEDLNQTTKAIDFIKVIGGIKTACRNHKFKETINLKRNLNKKSLIGRPKLDIEIRNKVLQLRARGMSYREIVNLIGRQNISKASVSRIINDERQS